jgi:hypothetical protein
MLRSVGCGISLDSATTSFSFGWTLCAPRTLSGVQVLDYFRSGHQTRVIAGSALPSLYFETCRPVSNPFLRRQ